MLERWLNLELLLNPLNWITVWLMISLVVLAITYLAPYGAKPSDY